MRIIRREGGRQNDPSAPVTYQVSDHGVIRAITWQPPGHSRASEQRIVLARDMTPQKRAVCTRIMAGELDPAPGLNAASPAPGAALQKAGVAPAPIAPVRKAAAATAPAAPVQNAADATAPTAAVQNTADAATTQTALVQDAADATAPTAPVEALDAAAPSAPVQKAVDHAS
jgi:hypothetical protein